MLNSEFILTVSLMIKFPDKIVFCQIDSPRTFARCFEVHGYIVDLCIKTVPLLSFFWFFWFDIDSKAFTADQRSKRWIFQCVNHGYSGTQT